MSVPTGSFNRGRMDSNSSEKTSGEGSHHGMSRMDNSMHGQKEWSLDDFEQLTKLGATPAPPPHRQLQPAALLTPLCVGYNLLVTSLDTLARARPFPQATVLR